MAGEANTYYIRHNASNRYHLRFNKSSGTVNQLYSANTDSDEIKWIAEPVSTGFYLKNKAAQKYLSGSSYPVMSTTKTRWDLQVSTNQNMVGLDTSMYTGPAAGTIAVTGTASTAPVYDTKNFNNLVFRIHNGSGRSLYVDSTGKVNTSSTQPLDAFELHFEYVSTSSSGDVVRIKHAKTGRYLRGAYYPSDSLFTGLGSMPTSDRWFSTTQERLQWYVKKTSTGYTFMNKAGRSNGYLFLDTRSLVPRLSSSATTWKLEIANRPERFLANDPWNVQGPMFGDSLYGAVNNMGVPLHPREDPDPDHTERYITTPRLMFNAY